ncbi:hypothetical protein SAMN04488038_10634 [Solimonas aquatica]|uniref:Zinc-binding metallo-peptidase n=1 Tax=Solimonas aquatica TaxID=489703 RepID=A0A1H9FM97_9GAMM|nr:hypothetical protein [Solimonas aquatica]SEQ39067.1 hypothetical protein SAMN04488038_10634 [Solimonas aquatica]
MASAAGSIAARIDLNSLPEEALLKLRLCSLPLQIEDSWLQARVAQLHRELAAREIRFAPRCFLADEWLTPENEPEIGIPFYLAHPRLIELQKKMLLEAEGETPEWCMKLLRHEAGHALSYAYGLHRKRSWQQVFGHSSQAYEETYRFRPYSKAFVRHLDYYYAQYHPDEDFCETFAVWLTPGLDWRRKYQGWKALDKLLFVDRLMASIAGKAPQKAQGRQFWKISSLRSTLGSYYRKRRYTEAEDFPEFHDANLRRMFGAATPGASGAREVARLLQTHRKSLLITVSSWSGERRYMVNEVYKAILQRARALQLLTEDPEPVAVMQLTAYLSSLMMNYRYTNRLRGED